MLHRVAVEKSQLLFQHIQFRRIEKFMKNYLDAG